MPFQLEPIPPKRILLLTPQFPYPPHQGTTIRNHNLIVQLSQRHELHLLSFGNPAESRDTPVHAMCRSVRVVPTPCRSMGQRVKGLLFSRLPDMAQRLPSAEYSAALHSLLTLQDPDVLQVEGIELAQYLLDVSARRTQRRRPLLVFDDHNAEYVLQQRAFESDSRSAFSWDGDAGRRWIAAAYSLVQWRRLRAYERRACHAADRVVAVSDTDAQALRALVPGLEPLVVPNGVDMRFYTEKGVPADRCVPSDLSAGANLVFTGKMDFRPNVDAVLWFAREVLPRIRTEVTDVRFWVVGKDPHPRLAALSEDQAVTLTGRVDDVRPYIAAAAVYVVPLRIGGGTRLKVLEAMAMGKAIVSTALGCEGFDLHPGQELMIADSAAEFAAAVVALLRDPERRDGLGRAARDFAGSGYDWSRIVPKLEIAYHD